MLAAKNPLVCLVAGALLGFLLCGFLTVRKAATTGNEQTGNPLGETRIFGTPQGGIHETFAGVVCRRAFRTSMLAGEASAARGFGGGGFRAGGFGGGFRGAAIGGFRGAAVVGGLRARGLGFRGAAVAGTRGFASRPAWSGRQAWWGGRGWRRRFGWGWPLAAGVAVAGLYGAYGGSCWAWNGYDWVNVCYDYGYGGYYPYAYW
jgi:hypothetical protein